MAEDINLNELDDLLSGLGRELEPEKDDFGPMDPIVDDLAEEASVSTINEEFPIDSNEKVELENDLVDSAEHDAEWKEIEGFLEEFDYSFSGSSPAADDDDGFLDLTSSTPEAATESVSMSNPKVETDLDSDSSFDSRPEPEPETDSTSESISDLAVPLVPDVDPLQSDGSEEFEDDFLKELEGTEIEDESSIPELDVSVPDAMPVPDVSDGLPISDFQADDSLTDFGDSSSNDLALDGLLDDSVSKEESLSELDDLFSDSTDENVDEIGDIGSLLEDDSAGEVDLAIPDLDPSEFEQVSEGEPQKFDDLFDEGSESVDIGSSPLLNAEDSGNSVEETGPLDLTDEDLNTIKRQIMFLTPKVQKLTRAAIVEQLLPEDQNNQLIRMLLSGKSNNEIKKFFEETLNEDVEENEEDILDAVPQSLSEGSNPLAKAWPVIRVAALFLGSVALIVGAFLLLVKPRIDAKNAYDLGLKQIVQGKYILAEKNFYSGESLIGQDLEWYNKYGIAYRKRKEYGRAIKKFRDGLKITANDFGTMLNISETYIHAGDYVQARSNLKSILKLYPKNPNVLEKLGDLFIKLGDDKKEPKFYRDAYGYYKKIIDDNWESLPGQFKVMLSYIKRDMFAETMTKLKHISSIKKDAMNVPVLTELGLYYQTKNKYFESKKVLKSVLLQDWEYHKAHFYLARYYREQNDYKRALLHYKNAVKFFDESAKYHNELGEIYLNFNDQKIPSAMKHFNLAIKYDSKLFKPYLNLGDLYFNKLSSADLNLKNQQYKQALYYYQKVADLAPRNYANRKYSYNFGWLYYRNGQVKSALQKWQKIYDKNPFHPAVSFVMGNAFLHLRKDELARAEYEKVIDYYVKITKNIPRVDPGLKRHQNVIKTLSNAYNNLGIAFEMKNQRTKDRKWERKALLAFWKSTALSEKIYKTDYSYSKNNTRYILHRDIKRGMSIAPELKNYSIPKTLYYEEQ